MGIARIFCICAIVSVALSAAYGQSTPPPLPTEKPAVFDGKRNPKEDKSRLRDLSGYVRDSAGAPIGGAVVQLKQLNSGRTIDYITKNDGSYSFSALNMDIDYELTAKRDGFGEPVKKKLTKWDTRRPAILNFELEKKS